MWPRCTGAPFSVRRGKGAGAVENRGKDAADAVGQVQRDKDRGAKPGRQTLDHALEKPYAAG